MRRLATSTFLVSTLFTASAWAQSWPASDPSYAQPAATGAPELFGDKGQLVLTSDFDLDFRSWSTSEVDGVDGQEGTSLTVSPAIDFFIGKNLSLGGTVILDRFSSEDNTEMTFSLGPQVGYNLSLGSALSLWPRVGLLYSYATQELEDTDTEGSGSALSLTAFVPLLFHPAPHFFVGIGPRLSLDLTSKWEGDDAPKTTVFGLDFVIGGWL